MKFIIEHLEPELFEWCIIEYRHISEIAGRENLIFTNIKDQKGQNRLRKFGRVHNKSISELDFRNVCVLSQYAKKTLTKKTKINSNILFSGEFLETIRQRKGQMV